MAASQPIPAFRGVRWIWAPDATDERNAYHWFRTTFLVSSGDGHRLRITADSRYRAWVNGGLLGDGPAPSIPRLMYYDAFELDDLLREGTNDLAVIGRFTGVQPGRLGGLLAEVVDASGATVTATGDGTWRVRPGDAWNPDTYAVSLNRFDPFQEWFDARKMPQGWPGDDRDDGWTSPATVDGRWAVPVARPVPRPRLAPRTPTDIVQIEECTQLAVRDRADLSITLSTVGTALRHARVESASAFTGATGSAVLACSTEHLRDRTFDGVRDPCLTLDFGRVITAYIELDVEGPAGAVIDLGVAERLIDGRFNNAIEGQFAFRYVLAEGRQTWRTFAWRGFRFLRLRLSGATAPVRFHRLDAITTEYPFEPRGRFESSDPTLNAVFEICRTSIQLCCNESISDTPWREQSQWLGDAAAVTLGGIHACFGDLVLPAKFLRQAAASRLPHGLLANVNDVVTPFNPDRVIPDFSLWWVMALWRHYQLTGDRTWPEGHRDVVASILDAHLAHAGSDGLITDMPGWVLIDWAPLDHAGSSAALNAILHGALMAGISLASTIGDHAMADRFGRSATAIRNAFSARFLDPASGLFADAAGAYGRSDRRSEHANFAAIRFGLTDDVRSAHIVRRLSVDRDIAVTEAQPFFTAVVLQALHRAGRRDLALDVIRHRWGTRMVDRGATSCYEEWGINGSWRDGEYRGFLRSLSHAWSAHPAEFLISNLAGVEIVEPGCTRVRLDPYLGMDYDVRFPTPLGPIDVTVEAGKAAVSGPLGMVIDVAPFRS